MQTERQMSLLTTKPTKWPVRPAKAQISLGIRPVWSVFTVRLKKAWVLSYLLNAWRRLIRLHGCQGWSVSSLGEQIILLVVSWGGSNSVNSDQSVPFWICSFEQSDLGIHVYTPFCLKAVSRNFPWHFYVFCKYSSVFSWTKKVSFCLIFDKSTNCDRTCWYEDGSKT